MAKRIIRINPADNVAVVLADEIKAGETLTEGGVTVTLKDDMIRGHKVALTDIAQGGDVVKYGYPIGHATSHITAGEHVHSHNLATSLDLDLEYTYNPVTIEAKPSSSEPPTINGYLRANGEMGIRNELWIVPTVGCVNGQAQAIVKRLTEECDTCHVDDVRAFTHNYGCSQLDTDHENTRSALAALIKHPNAGGVLVLGLGCENNQLATLRDTLGDYDPSRIKFLVAQEVDDEIEEGVAIGKQLIETMKNDRRQPLPMSLLKVGLKCGGSDGLSGITANPLVGMVSDKLIECGATTIMTEVPEMFGAETILMNRAVDRKIFNKITSLINDFKDYFRSYGQPIYENPSPGNKAGGITTLEEKSLGCVQKGGTKPVVDVIGYARQATKAGLNLLNAPGNDLVASTALALAGCHIVLFTTGRGTPFGTFVPTMKISTNTALYEKKKHWIDFNAGTIIEGESINNASKRMLDTIIDTASGMLLEHELTGAKEIAIFKTGVTL